MGSLVEAKCLDCGRHFELKVGGGFTFHIVRCDACGRAKPITFARLGDLHLRYLKGLDKPYCVEFDALERQAEERPDLTPISEAEYAEGIGAIAGKCGCGGQYRMDAPARCPKCKSTAIEELYVRAMYD